MPLPTIPSGNVSSATASTAVVTNSVRFNDGDSPQLHRSQPGTPTSTKIFTWSGWFKLGSSTSQITLASSFTSGSIYDQIKIMALATHNQVLRIEAGSNESNAIDLKANLSLRDPTAWTHLCLAVDTSQGVAANRDKVYINGTQITSWQTETHSTQNDTWHMNASGKTIKVGVYDNGTPQDFFDGYLAEVVQVDGQQLAPTSFGEFDEDSPTIWKPIDVSGLTFGNNGYYMDFEDSSSLGNDVAGKGNFTVANLAAADQATDIPTNNFCTMNPLEKNTNNTQAFSEGNNVVVITGGYAPVGSTMSVSSGKWYVECHIDSTVSSGDLNIMLGINGSYNDPGDNTLGYSASAYGYYLYNGYMLNNNSGNSNTGGSQYVTSPGGGVTDDNKTWSLALDCDNNKLYVALDGTWLASGDPAAGSNGFAITAPASTDWGAYRFANGVYFGHTNTFSWNFGGCPGFAISSGNSDGNNYGNFEYTVPSGYYALCTKNLAEYG